MVPGGRRLLAVRDLVIKFRLRGQTLTVVRGASLDLYRGETLCIVGESGSGKTVLAKSLLGLLEDNGWVDSGAIEYRQHNLARFRRESQWLQIRGREIAMVFQDPVTSLNPLRTVGGQIGDAVELHQGLRGRAAKQAALDILADVGIPRPRQRYSQFPFQFSGGMRQRVAIGIALACRPRILICDEPTTALDVTVQAQILQLLVQLKQAYGLTVVFITHDLGVVARIAQRVAVMYAGDIIEVGLAREVFCDPRHPYTVCLLCSLPQLAERGKPLAAIPGAPPNMEGDIPGDAFAPRNPWALEIDFIHRPPFFPVSTTHKAKTWLLDPRAPKIDLPPPVIRLRKLWRERNEW